MSVIDLIVNALVMIVFVFVISLMAFSAWSGTLVRGQLRNHALFHWRDVREISAKYVWYALVPARGFDRPADDRAWGILYCALWFSTFGSAVLAFLQLSDLIDLAWLEHGTWRKLRWLSGHVFQDCALILFHVSAGGAIQNTPEVFDARDPQ